MLILFAMSELTAKQVPDTVENLFGRTCKKQGKQWSGRVYHAVSWNGLKFPSSRACKFPYTYFGLGKNGGLSEASLGGKERNSK